LRVEKAFRLNLPRYTVGPIDLLALYLLGRLSHVHNVTTKKQIANMGCNFFAKIVQNVLTLWSFLIE
jgi:hypothetical protein